VPLPDLYGHEPIRESLVRLARQSALPHSMLIHGPAGAGKERLGLWIAQLLLCEAPAQAPCGACASCRIVPRLEHPDVHWFFPLPRPEGGSPEKLRERLEEHRAAELQLRRDNPFHLPRYEKAPAYFLATIRSLQHLASMRPVVGRRKVFVVGDAEMMVPQESSPEAANAFLKLLEEPPSETTLILTSSHPGALLPTIRSRVLALRVSGLPDSEIERLLLEGKMADGEEAATIARRARGSVARALRLCGTPRNPGTPDAEREAGRQLLLAALSVDGNARLAEANARRPSGIKQEFVGELESLAEWLRDLLAVAAGAADRVSDPDALAMLRRAVEQRRVPPQGVIAAVERVAAAREMALGNVNPQLILAELLKMVQRDLRPESTRIQP